MIVEDTHLLDKLVVPELVVYLPLVEGDKICLLEIPLVVLTHVEPVGYSLVGDGLVEVPLQLLYIAV
jgi:hypothetical protein